MGYLTKSAILQAYELLSHLSPDPSVQGATQKVSAIRHFMALDSFYKSKSRDCNTREKEDKNDFIAHVGYVCDVCPNFYTTNFYAPLKEHTKDFAVGSNFYSAGQVSASLVNPDKVFEYPKRGGKPLFQIKEGTLIRNVGMYENFNSYMDSTKEKVALVLWILRKTNLTDGNSYESIYNAFRGIYTSDLVDIFFSNRVEFEKELASYHLDLNDNFYSIRPQDINSLFNVEKKDKVHLQSNDMTTFERQNEKYLTALCTKPFMLLAGISGTGKSRIVREFAFKCCPKELQDKDGTTPGNYCMIEVKPNWHDSTELLGYWSNLQEKYIFTKFVKFLVKAKMYPDVPFFVCLDEMNLAPVEQYFAEFLSVLETRRIVKDDDGERIKIKSGALVDKDYFKTFGAIGDKHLENDRQIYFKLFNINEKEEMDKIKCESKSLLEEGLTLPENVYIIGTVNMDDTTHQFSRKVIDRAMTIEMNGGALEDIFKDEDELTYSESPLTMDSLRNKYVTAKEVIKKCDAVAADEQISNYIQGKTGKGLPQRLQSINMVLSGTPFTVSYRVMNELTLYLAVLLDKAEEDGKKVTFDTFIPYVETAIDKILLMKILPRVEGDDEMFRISEKERRVNELDSQVNDEDDMSHEFTKLDWLKQIAPQHTEDNKEEYMAVDKLSEMIDRLNRQSFTRYWP